MSDQLTVSEILALPARTGSRLLKASDSPALYFLPSGLSGDAAVVILTELMDPGAVIPTILTPAANYELPIPADGAYEGQKKLYHITPTAAINLTLTAGILTASDSLVTFPKALTANKTYVVQLMWSGSAWMLVTIVGGF